jgi:hypothetical protein
LEAILNRIAGREGVNVMWVCQVLPNLILSAALDGEAKVTGLPMDEASVTSEDVPHISLCNIDRRKRTLIAYFNRREKNGIHE